MTTTDTATGTQTPRALHRTDLAVSRMNLLPCHEPGLWYRPVKARKRCRGEAAAATGIAGA